MSRKKLVAYFSATGTTRTAAQKLARAAGADLFEIRPAVPYTADDLDWMNKKSRSTAEMNDPSARPALAEAPGDLGGYDTIFLGFPIWWYTAPRIISTFLESADFSGRTIVLFATSGGSGLGKTAADLKPCCAAKITDGRMLTRVSEADMRAWAEGLKL